MTLNQQLLTKVAAAIAHADDRPHAVSYDVLAEVAIRAVVDFIMEGK